MSVRICPWFHLGDFRPVEPLCLLFLLIDKEKKTFLPICDIGTQCALRTNNARLVRYTHPNTDND